TPVRRFDTPSAWWIEKPWRTTVCSARAASYSNRHRRCSTVARMLRATRLQWRRLLFALAAGLIALAVSHAPLGGLNVIWPGRIVTLPIAMLFGPWFGLVAAVTGGIPYFTLTPAML